MTKSRGIGRGGKRENAGRDPVRAEGVMGPTLQVRVTEAERELLRATAEGMGLTLSAYLRHRLGLT